MRRLTSLLVTALGAVLLLAVTAEPPFLNLRIVGAVLIVTGLAGLRVPEQAGRWIRGGGLYRRAVVVKGLTEKMPPPLAGPRVPLEDLLSPGRDDDCALPR